MEDDERLWREHWRRRDAGRRSGAEKRVTMRLLGFSALVGSLGEVVLLAFLMSADVSPSQTALIVVWLLPITFGLHVFEEFGVPGGFVTWSARARPLSADAMTSAHLWRVNGIGGAATLLVALGAFDYAGGYSWLGLCAWMMVLFSMTENGLFHVRGTVESRLYSPGVVTSILLYIPLTVVGVAILVSIGAVEIVTVPICAVVGILVFRRLQRGSRQHELSPGGGPHAEPTA
jgi:hypothetical protein